MLSTNGFADCSQKAASFQQDAGQVYLSGKVNFYGHHQAETLLRLVGDFRAYPQPTPPLVLTVKCNNRFQPRHSHD